MLIIFLLLIFIILLLAIFTCALNIKGLSFAMQFVHSIISHSFIILNVNVLAHFSFLLYLSEFFFQRKSRQSPVHYILNRTASKKDIFILGICMQLEV